MWIASKFRFFSIVQKQAPAEGTKLDAYHEIWSVMAELLLQR